MTVDVTTVLEKLGEGPYSIAFGTTYPELLAIIERMQAQDASIVFDSMRPMGEEFWNFIDGRRSVQEIAEAVCFEFGFDLDAEHFLPLIERAAQKGLVAFR